MPLHPGMFCGATNMQREKNKNIKQEIERTQETLMIVYHDQ